MEFFTKEGMNLVVTLKESANKADYTPVLRENVFRVLVNEKSRGWPLQLVAPDDDWETVECVLIQEGYEAHSDISAIIDIAVDSEIDQKTVLELTKEDKAFLIQTALDHPDFEVNILVKDLKVGDIFSHYDFMEVLEVSEHDELNLALKVKYNEFGSIGTVVTGKNFKQTLYKRTVKNFSYDDVLDMMLNSELSSNPHFLDEFYLTTKEQSYPIQDIVLAIDINTHYKKYDEDHPFSGILDDALSYLDDRKMRISQAKEIATENLIYIDTHEPRCANFSNVLFSDSRIQLKNKWGLAYEANGAELTLNFEADKAYIKGDYAFFKEKSNYKFTGTIYFLEKKLAHFLLKTAHNPFIMLGEENSSCNEEFMEWYDDVYGDSLFASSEKLSSAFKEFTLIQGASATHEPR